MRTNQLITGLGTIPLLLMPGCSHEGQNDRPNIVFIMADDLGYGDLSCLNEDSRIRTPFMDQVAREGMTFTNAHSPSAVCTPTRYGVITGEYCFRTSLKSGVLTGYSPGLIDPGRTTVAELMRSAGYRTACIGKWHLGLDWKRRDTTLPLLNKDQWVAKTANVDYTAPVPGGPADHGFDYSFIIPSSLDIVPYCYIRNGKLIAPMNDTIAGNNEPRGVFWRSGDIQDGFRLETTLNTLTDEAVKFIDDQSKARQPFFLYFPLTAPHTPWLPGDAYRGKSGAGTYGDFVMHVDDCIGMVMEALRKNQLDKNTILIITSDNGSNWTPKDISTWGHRANGIFRGQKSDAWEGGHHVPFLVRWPNKVKGGRQSDQLVCLTDLFATAGELTGYRNPGTEGPDSFSFLQALTRKKSSSPLRTSIIHHSIDGMFAITAGDWKLIDGKGSGGWSAKGKPEDPEGQLYNMKTDPGETENLYDANPELVSVMRKQLDEIRNFKANSKPRT
jgi:arylsulfatase A